MKNRSAVSCLTIVAVRASHQTMQDLIGKATQLRLDSLECQALLTRHVKPSRTAAFRTRPDSQ